MIIPCKLIYIIACLIYLSRCNYGANGDIQFVDENSGRRLPYHCSQEALLYQDFCSFHDRQEKNRDNENINGLFLELLQAATAEKRTFIGIGFRLEALNFPKQINCKMILEHAILSDVNLDGVHFRDDVVLSYGRLSNVSFYNSRFEGKAYFIYTEFEGEAHFRDAKFYSEANFNGAKFNSLADFQSTFFGDNVRRLYSSLSETTTEKKPSLTYFNETRFLQGVRFDGSTFKRQTLFDGTVFKKFAIFVLARFSTLVMFNGAHFDCNVSFNLTTFSDDAYFFRANFIESSKNNQVDFHGAVFVGEADFRSCQFGNIYFNREYPADSDKISRESNKTKFLQKADFSEAFFGNMVNLFNTSFDNDAIFTKSTFDGPVTINHVSFTKVFFDSIDFNAEIDFNIVGFPVNRNLILVYFSNSTFRKRVRFKGTVHNTIDLSSVSFSGVDLANVEFSNVTWIRTHGAGFLQRLMIIDEVLLQSNNNFEDVIKIYGQLRKNYESKLLFNEASHFFVGEMESRRKSLEARGRLARLGTLYYQLYRYIAWYGESVSLPLVVWAPLVIGFFTYFRLLTCDNSGLQAIFGNPTIEGETCNLPKLVVDSIAAFFPIPFSKNHFDTLEHIIGLPILGTAFIALKRRFERTK